MTTVSVLGGGAWGTALALTAYRAGNRTTLWARDADQVQIMRQKRENQKYLPHIILPENLEVTSLLEQALQSNIILLACPAQNLRSFLQEIKDLLSPDSYLVICAKGIEIDTGKLMNEVLADVLPHHCNAILSGPTFALDVAEGRPTAATLATEEITTARWLASSLSCPTFRLYPTTDCIGVSLSGALKNVIAIAAGITMARQLGENARASLITRGLAEITRLGLAMGAQLETFLGLSGVGDIVLTCNSTYSRNTGYGFKIGQKPYFEHNDSFTSSTLTEGVYTAKASAQLASNKGVEMPIVESVYRIVYHQSPIEQEINRLLSRPLKVEY